MNKGSAICHGTMYAESGDTRARLRDGAGGILKFLLELMGNDF
jgi:hypothetical protein